MNLTIEHLLDEKEVKRLFRKAFFAYAAPWYVLGVVCILVGVVLWMQNNEGGRPYYFTFMAMLAFVYLIGWPRMWRMYRELFRRKGVFEHPTVTHLADTFFETTCGENHSKQEYRILTHYFCLKDCIVLMHKRSIMSVIEKKEFPDGGKEWIECLEANGVERLRIWGQKRLWIVLVLLFLLVCCLILHVAARRANDEWGKYITCVNNLKMTGTALIMYADDNQGCYPAELITLVSQYLIDIEEEDCICCPKTELKYNYVPYGKMTDETAVCQPIVIDGAGSHWIKGGPGGKSSPLTPILFADGHVETFTALADYMDIYDQYAKFLRKEDADVLRKCCEAWAKDAK